MTIGKAARCLCLCVLCVLLVACSSEKAYPFDALMNTPEPQQGSTASYRIVVASDCSASLREAANGLAVRLAETLSVSAPVVYDAQTDLVGENVTEIVLGEADRPGVKSLMRGMRRDDYRCQTLEGRIVIGGVHDAATLIALEHFYREILPSATAECLLQAEAGFFYVGNYPKTKVCLNGFELTEYRLLLPDSASSEWRVLAESLRDAIAQKSGYWLRILEEKDSDGVGKFLTLRQSSDDALAHLAPSEDGMVLSARTAYGVSVAASELCSLLFADGTALSYDCRVESPQAISYRSAYTVATVLGEHWLPAQTPSDISEVVGPVRDSEADVLLFASATEADRDYLSASLSDYTLLGTEQAGETVLPLYQKGTDVTVIATYSGALSCSVLRVGDEASGFLVAHISGTVEAGEAVVLPECLRQTALPVVLLVQTVGEGSALLGETASSAGLSLSFERAYSFDGRAYSYACYVTPNAFSVTPGEVNARGGCAELTVERISAF